VEKKFWIYMLINVLLQGFLIQKKPLVYHLVGTRILIYAIWLQWSSSNKTIASSFHNKYGLEIMVAQFEKWCFEQFNIKSFLGNMVINEPSFTITQYNKQVLTKLQETQLKKLALFLGHTVLKMSTFILTLN
jgi:hypothetical protein